MKIVSLYNTCIECDDIITEPICPDCLAQRMQIVLQEHDPILAYEIRNCAAEAGETACLFCKKKMNLCAHCFSKEVYFFLKEKDRAAADLFISRFDFDLRKNIALA